jgi:hypothetical protein
VVPPFVVSGYTGRRDGRVERPVDEKTDVVGGLEVHHPGEEGAHHRLPHQHLHPHVKVVKGRVIEDAPEGRHKLNGVVCEDDSLRLGHVLHQETVHVVRYALLCVSRVTRGECHVELDPALPEGGGLDIRGGLLDSGGVLLSLGHVGEGVGEEGGIILERMKKQKTRCPEG